MNNTKTINVDMIINGRHLTGECFYNVEKKEVTLAEGLKPYYLCADGDLAWARFNGRSFAPVMRLLEWEVMRLAGVEGMEKCNITGFYTVPELLVTLENGQNCFKSLAFYFEQDDAWYYIGYTCERELRTENGSEYFRAPSSFWDNLYYCEECGRYVYEDDYYGEGLCRFCHDSHIIENYGESHRHNDNPVFFGDYKENFAGLGFELEVDCDSTLSRRNVDTARNLCNDAGLEPLELRYAYDGSLNYGFEIISQPHTIKDFWNKSAKWEKMLRTLAEKGYKSHDAGTCGLHVHVSRELFGKTEEQQDTAISKVYTFFDNNWDDIVKISRRRSFSYCDKNSPRYGWESNRYKCWKKSIKGNGGHDRALNNRNPHTFEYRLGRGTLNPWSFFAWVDFVLTITKNAKRITVEKVVSNDIASWLCGIKETTARYILKKGAFTSTIYALFPAITWENDNTDNNY